MNIRRNDLTCADAARRWVHGHPLDPSNPMPDSIGFYPVAAVTLASAQFMIVV